MENFFLEDESEFMRSIKTTLLLALTIPLAIGSCSSQSYEDSIVLINAGDSDNGKLAKMISIINGLGPKVISIDIALTSQGDQDDVLLYQSLDKCANLIVPTIIRSIGDNRVFIGMACSLEILPLHAKTGFVSAEIEDGKNQMERFNVKQLDLNEDIEYNFAVRTAMSFDSLRTIDFILNNPTTVDVSYRNGKRKFRTFSSDDILNSKLTKKDIEKKIVMIGYLGPRDDDKFFSPLNRNSREPDMFGLEFLAIIVSQVLEYKGQ
jgi:CHASE2 domain-containing sensor protein